MTGLLIKKYHIAILDESNNGFVTKVIGALKTWYSNRVIIEIYTNTHEMFEAVNLNKARNKPFDLAIVSSELLAERLVLQRANPKMKVIVCEDEQTFKQETSKVLL